MAPTLDIPLLTLDTPYLDDGIRSTYFFNGRLLSGEDLSQEQQARDEGLQRLGRALGEGIASGLKVTALVGGATSTEQIVTVEPGLAINRLGQVLELGRRVRVNLLESASEDTTPALTDPGGFQSSRGLGAGLQGLAPGVYVLVIAPAEGREGTAPVSGLGNGNVPCNARRRVEGVRFRLLRLNLPETELEDTGRLRNRVAHLCFGTTEPTPRGVIAHPFGMTPERDGRLDAHGPFRLTDGDVPLALIHWGALSGDKPGIRFVDLHSVRRRPTRMLDTGRWSPLVGERRASEAEALFLQFQEHLETLVLALNAPEKAKATDHFAYLPPAGVLPLQHDTTRGFNAGSFFEELPVRGPFFIEGARLEPILREARSLPPIALDSRELIWLYRVRENQPPAQPYLVFASGHLAFQGEARIDVTRWDYSHATLNVTDPDALWED